MIKSNATHRRVIVVRIYFWELECQILSNIYFSYFYLSGVSGCLGNALCFLMQQTVIAECWLSTGYHFLFSITYNAGGFKLFDENAYEEPQ